MVLDDLAVLLQMEGLGTVGTNLFEGRIPQDAPGVPDALIALFAVPGLSPEHTHDIAGPAVEQAVVQVRVRGTATQGGYAAAWQKVTQAFLALDGVHNQTVNGVYYRQIRALQSPFGLAEDESARPHLVFNVLCQKEP